MDAVSITFQRKAPDFRGFFRFSPTKTTCPIFAQLRTLCLDKTDRPVGWHSLSPPHIRRTHTGCPGIESLKTELVLLWLTKR